MHYATLLIIIDKNYLLLLCTIEDPSYSRALVRLYYKAIDLEVVVIYISKFKITRYSII